jgi:hypothetical protein
VFSKLIYDYPNILIFWVIFVDKMYKICEYQNHPLVIKKQKKVAVTYQIVITSDTPKEFFEFIKTRDAALVEARRRYESLIDFINMNQAPHFDQLQFSRDFFDTLDRRFGINQDYFTIHLFTRYGNNIIIQNDSDDTPVKIPVLTNKCHTAILKRIKQTLLDFDIHKFGIVISYKFVTDNGQTFADFDEMILSFKKSEEGI